MAVVAQLPLRVQGGDPGVVDEHIEAIVLVGHVGRQQPDVVESGEIRDVRAVAVVSRSLAKLGSHALASFAVAAVNQHGGAAIRERTSGRQAQAVGGPGDQDRLFGERAHPQAHGYPVFGLASAAGRSRSSIAPPAPG